MTGCREIPERSSVADPRTIPTGPSPALRPDARPVPPRPPARLPPPRPAVTSSLAPPGRPVRPPRPWTLRTGVAAAVAACVAGLIGLAGIGAGWQELQRRLSATAGAARPAASAQLVHEGVRTTGLLVVAVVGLLAVGTLLWAVLVLLGRAWARWPLAVTGLLTVAVALALQGVLAGAPAADRGAFLVQAGLAVLASALLLAAGPRARRG
jgi:hypothetical protein